MSRPFDIRELSLAEQDALLEDNAINGTPFRPGHFRLFVGTDGSILGAVPPVLVIPTDEGTMMVVPKGLCGFFSVGEGIYFGGGVKRDVARFIIGPDYSPSSEEPALIRAFVRTAEPDCLCLSLPSPGEPGYAVAKRSILWFDYDDYGRRHSGEQRDGYRVEEAAP